MNAPAIMSTAAAVICLLLSIWLFAVGNGNQVLQDELQTKQQELQGEQQDVQIQQQKFQQQQADINAGNQLAQQIGPAVLKDLGALAVQGNNEKIKKLLARYGVNVKESDPVPDATIPSTSAGSSTPAASATPAPRSGTR